MAGKATAICSRGVSYALDSLSKNTLIDFVVDLAIRNIGEDQATDENLLQWIQDNIEPVHRLRRQNPVNLLAKLARIQISDKRYLQEHQSCEKQEP